MLSEVFTSASSLGDTGLLQKIIQILIQKFLWMLYNGQMSVVTLGDKVCLI